MRGRPTQLGYIVFVTILILVVVGAYLLLRGNQAKPQTVDSNLVEKIEVTKLDASRSVRMTVYGPIVSNEGRESYSITVSQDSRQFEARKGYDATVVGTSSYGNSLEAYTQLVFALSRANFDARRTLKTGEDTDDRGVCPSGKKYVYDILEFDSSVASAWTTSCKNAKGTFGGSNTAIKVLFDKQIPDLSTVIKSIKLR
ncbi:MAG: hypothetical protein WBB39_03840 [Candidatus Saccharimonadales bacterium]